MRTRLLFSAMLCGALACSAPRPVPLEGAAPKQWEYLVDNDVDPAHLAELGRQNWELVAVDPFDARQGVRTAWYKRPRSGAAK